MAYERFEPSQQAAGAFDGGRIQERKPIGFPQDGGKLSPMSNLFYWAHAWSDEGGLIGEHPHRGFEIVTIVLKGEIQHYDSQLKDWKTLQAGDAQIIRAGNGITHAERLLPQSAIFQIWFDPGLEQSLSRPASYNDYKSSDFPVEVSDGVSVVSFSGEKAPMKMESPEVVMQQVTMSEGSSYSMSPSGQIVGAFVLDGEINIDGKSAVTGDFILIKDEETALLTGAKDARVFVLSVPEKVNYHLYTDLVGRSN
ncbi:MAG: pirin family protein [Flavobacteriales bacterium]|nr:pirin family protein [Flavobacteriales bacterium]